MNTPNNTRLFKILTITIFVLGFFLRIIAFDQEGGDHSTYKQAVQEFMAGINPYRYTVASYQTSNLKHGYAYLPTLLYIQTSLVQLNGLFHADIPTKILWKIPVLIADIGVAIILYRAIKKSRDSEMIAAVGVFFWFFNPYFILRYEYTNYESLPIFFTLLALLYLGKKDFIAGMFFALAVSLKTFPIILLAIFILKAKNIPRFILGGFLVAVAISIPFLTSEENLQYYVNGSLLVHAERGIQGRPLFSFFTYYLQNFGVSLLQSELSKTYTFIALTGSQLLPLYLLFKKKISNLWMLTLSSFCVYYLFVPVLNRTHILWGLPFIFLGLLEIYKDKIRSFYISVFIVYITLSFYYFLWDKGFRNPIEFAGKVWVDPVYEDRKPFAIISDLYVKAVRLKKSLFP